MSESFDLVVIGGGPGGYVAALKASQLGKKVACIDRRPAFGGTCLNVGCIPSKALLDSSELYEQARHKFAKHGIKVPSVELDLKTMMLRKEQVVKSLTDGIAGLFRKNKITPFTGTGKLVGPKQVEVTGLDGTKKTIIGEAILLATGSEVASLPSLPFDGKFIGGSTEALSYDTVPKHLLVVGGGYIGLELGSVWLRLGSKVTVVEFLPRILPLTDNELASMMHKSLEKQGMTFHLSTKVTGSTISGDQVTLKAETSDGEKTFVGDKVLVAVGRRPFTTGLGLTEVGVTVEAKSGKIPVDSKFQTNVAGVYAIGDLIAGPMLAHKAQEEGVAFAEILCGHAAPLNYDMIPSVIYTWPEIASVGPTEEQLKEQKREYKIGKFPFQHLGRAKCMDEVEGIVKVLADAKTDRVLAVHIMGPRASDLIAEAVTTMEFSGSAEDITRIIHGHPTLSEALAEAARAAFIGKPLHG